MPFLDQDALRALRERELEPSQRFVVDYLTALGSRIEHREDNLIRAELTREQLCELEDRPANTWWVANSVPELNTLYLAFDESGEVSQSELAGSGSWRFLQMTESARRIGRMSRLRLVPRRDEGPLPFRPFLLFQFEVDFLCSRKWTKSVPVAVDLCEGVTSRTLAYHLLEREMDEQPVPKSLRVRREMSYKHAFETACECVKELIQEDAAVWDWHRHAAKRYRQEVLRVEDYFTQLAAEGDEPPTNARAKALEELADRFRPRIEARTALGLLLYCPVNELPYRAPQLPLGAQA